MLKILDNDYYDLIVNNILIPSEDTGDNITFLTDRYSLLHVPSSAEPCDLGRYSYASFPSLYIPTSTVALEESGVSAVQQNPYLALYGQGVLVAVLDTGIDYQHPAFKNSDGTTRILSIWDQTVQSGTIPEEFTFGSEYSRDQINEALQAENPLDIVPVTDTLGHGTAMASILAGTPSQDGTFSGVVPHADLVIVKIKEAKQNVKDIYFAAENAICYQESDAILAVRYAVTFARRLGRPISICFAMGSSQGGHDGRGALSVYLDYLSLLPGTSLAVAAGNEGNTQRHYFSSTPFAPYYNDVELRVGEADRRFALEIWSYSPARLSIDISSPNRESTQPVFAALNQCRRFNFIFNQTIIYVNNSLFEEESGDQLILLRFQNPLPGVWYLRLQNPENEAFSFHAWLPAGDLISDETFFLNSNPDITITSPGNGRHQLTVTAYNQDNGSILGESSRGFSRSGQVKPDIAAPGYQITCAIPGGRYGTATGTGTAAAQAAGISAMVFEWAIVRGSYPRMTGNDVGRLLISGSNRSSSSIYPNNIWGYGQININQLFERFTSR